VAATPDLLMVNSLQIALNHQAKNLNAFARFVLQPPNLVGKPTLSHDERNPAQFFNINAFATAPQFTIGTAIEKSRERTRVPGLGRCPGQAHDFVS
jgi:hypothetical protein